MKLKNVILLNLIAVFLALNCHAQEKISKNPYSQDSNYFDKRLQEYQVQSCLLNLLASIAKSNDRFYTPNKFFYSLSFNHGESQRYLNVSPELWHNAMSMDYTGILKIKNFIFLCRGYFENDSLFKKKGLNRKRVRLQQTKDSTDRIPYFLEPSLDGEFYDCKGMPIYIEVYTIGKIRGYEKKVHHTNMNKK